MNALELGSGGTGEKRVTALVNNSVTVLLFRLCENVHALFRDKSSCTLPRCMLYAPPALPSNVCTRDTGEASFVWCREILIYAKDYTCF